MRGDGARNGTGMVRERVQEEGSEREGRKERREKRGWKKGVEVRGGYYHPHWLYDNLAACWWY